MPHSEDPPSNGWIPAWKRLGFQLTGPTPSSYPQYYKRYYPNPPWYLQQTNSESSDNKVTGSTSMQGDHGDQKFDKQKKRKFDQTTLFRDFDRNAIESSGRASEPKVKKNRSKLDRQQDLAAEKKSTSPKGRNKSVKFTSETKEIDGDSNKHLLDEWAKTQNGGDDQFSKEEVSQFLPNPKSKTKTKPVVNEADATKNIKENKLKKPKAKDGKNEQSFSNSAYAKPQYLEYLTQFHTDRASWKFNKAHQISLLKNIFDVSQIPKDYNEALRSYIAGLQGYGARNRLREAATHTLKSTMRAEEDDGNDADQGARILKRQRKRVKLILRALEPGENSTSTETLTETHGKK